MNGLTQMSKSSRIGKYLIRLGIVIFLLATIGVLRSCFISTAPLDRYYRILRYTGWYPTNLPGKQARFFAFTGELMRSIFLSQGLQIEILDIDSDRLFETLDANLADVVMMPVIPTSSTEQRFYFSTPFYKTGPVLIVPIHSGIDSVTDLKDRLVAVKRNSPIVLDLGGYGLTFSPYDKMAVAFNDLAAGKIDGIIMPVVEAYVFIEAFFPGRFKVVTSPLNDEGVRLVTLKNAKEKLLIDTFNAELKKMKKDGRYKALLEKWGLSDPESESAKTE